MDKLKWKRRIALFLIYFVIFFLSSTTCYASKNDETLKEQQKEFGISDFIKNSNEYKGEFFENIDISEIMQNAINGKVDNSTFFKRVFNLIGQEFGKNLIGLGSILAIILIHSVLKSISEDLENNDISKIIYYVQYILIVTIIMTNFSNIIETVQKTCSDLVDFMNMLLPILTSLMIYTGSITTTSMIEPTMLFVTNLVGNIIKDIIIPLVLIFTSIIILSKLTDKIQLEKISKFMKSSITWLLGIVLTIFVGVISLEGTLSSSVDGITAKTTKAVVSSAIPIVGKILGDAVDTVLGCGIILKNAVGIVGIIIVAGICIIPILKLSVLTIGYKLLAGISEPIADKKIVQLLEQMGDVFKIFLAILSALAFMIIIGTALVLKISNSGMMYR